MTARIFTLLNRRAWIDRRIGELQRHRQANPTALLRLKAMRLAVETKLKGLLRRSAIGAFA